MRHGVFLDPDDAYPRLSGKSALVLVPEGVEDDSNTMVTAQFDDTEYPEAYGWWPFPISSFKLDPIVDRTD